MSWNEAEFGRDDGIICDVDYDSMGKHQKPCGAKTWVTDDQGMGYVCYECERGHHFAIQFDVEPEEHDQDCDCSECADNAVWEAIRDEEIYGNARFVNEQRNT